MLTSNRALNEGSSKQGNDLRASAGYSLFKNDTNKMIYTPFKTTPLKSELTSNWVQTPYLLFPFLFKHWVL